LEIIASRLRTGSTLTPSKKWKILEFEFPAEIQKLRILAPILRVKWILSEIFAVATE